ncbi:MAG: hypothetical protein B6D62_04725 [Candidatus Cloacimonas sp. 4484_275]|nr:MAG: hypothetical protein B6D62_04725 [Candidatus Cloacimonas sp. 4484_275]
MKKIFLLVFTVAISVSLFATEITFRHTFSEPIIKQLNQFQKIEFENTVQQGKIGEPSLPYLGIKLLLPEGESAVKIEVNGKNNVSIKGEYTLFPTQPNQKLSDSTIKKFAQPNPQIYSKNAIYPQNEY